MNDHDCGTMRAIMEQYPFPFVRPVYIDPKTLDLRVAGLAVELRLKTPAGNISKRGTTLCLGYCPFCGEKLKG